MASRAWRDAHENGVVNPEQFPPMALAGQARQDRTDRPELRPELRRLLHGSKKKEPKAARRDTSYTHTHTRTLNTK